MSQVFVVGCINRDYVSEVGQRPRAGEIETAMRLTLCAGGKGAKQSIAAARFGPSVALLARVGVDATGAVLREELRARGVDVTFVKRTAGAPTGAAFVTVTPDREFSIVVAPGANHDLDPSDVETAAPAIQSADVLLTGLEVPVAVVQRTIELAGPRTRVVLDSGPPATLPSAVLRRLDVLIASEYEASALLGETTVDAADAAMLAGRLLGKGPRAVVITFGASGVVVADRSSYRHFPSGVAPVMDTPPARDAFVGALAAGLSVGASVAEAATYGTPGMTANEFGLERKTS